MGRTQHAVIACGLALVTVTTAGCTGATTAEAAHAISEASSAAVPNAECPVTGKAVDPEVFMIRSGKRVYFCCAGCVGTWLMKWPWT